MEIQGGYIVRSYTELDQRQIPEKHERMVYPGD